MTEFDAQPASWQSGVIDEIVQQTPSIKSFFLRLQEPFVHTAGQHVDVRLTAPDGYQAMRSYSIASSAGSSPILELAIERLPNGEVSPFFHDVAAAGDEIELRGPLGGHFLWPEPTDKPVLLIGAGSGVVPLMAMMGLTPRRSRYGRFNTARSVPRNSTGRQSPARSHTATVSSY